MSANNSEITHLSDVAEAIGLALSQRCGGGQNDPQPTLRRVQREAEAMDFSTAEQRGYTVYHGCYHGPFTMAELESAISSLRSVSEGPDAVHNDMLRRLPTAALEELLKTFNSIWATGTFPAAWREATIIPVLKPGKSGSDSMHYRPISLTYSMCKLMEKLVNVRLSCFFFFRTSRRFYKRVMWL